jgi:hypothetical protein
MNGDEENGGGSLLGGLEHQDSREYGQQPSAQQQQQQQLSSSAPKPAASSTTNKIAERLKQMRNNSASNNNRGGAAYAPMISNTTVTGSTGSDNVGYKAPSMIGYSDMPTAAGAGAGQAVAPASRMDGSTQFGMAMDHSSMMSTSTSFAPVSLPPTHMGESTFSILDGDVDDHDGAAFIDPVNTGGGGATSPFLMDHDRISGQVGGDSSSNTGGSSSPYSMLEYMTTCVRDICGICQTYGLLAWEKYVEAPTWAQIVIGLILLALFVKLIDSL